MSSRCSPAARAHVAAATRRSIEERVARAESSIRAPGAIADMSCIESLLAADIDVFSGALANVAGFDVEALIDALGGGLKSGLSSEIVASGVARAICAHARERFEERTAGLSGTMKGIVAGVELPDYAESFGPSATRRSESRPVPSRPASATSPAFQNPAPATLPQIRQAPAPSNEAGAGGSEDELRAIWNAIGGGPER